jgi:hypothetical protein
MTSHRRLDAFGLKRPPERIDAGGISDDELRVITAFARRRLEIARQEMNLAPRENRSEKTL